MKKILLVVALLAPTLAHATVRFELSIKNAEGDVLATPALMVAEGQTGIVTFKDKNDENAIEAEYAFTVAKEHEHYLEAEIEIAWTEMVVENEETQKNTTISQELGTTVKQRIDLPYGKKVSATLPNAPITISVTAYGVSAEDAAVMASEEQVAEVTTQQNVQA
jgi:uncharacterized protein (DUF2344 family)